MLPLQQQSTLKRLLDDVVPDIDIVISNASRVNWNMNHQGHAPLESTTTDALAEKK